LCINTHQRENDGGREREKAATGTNVHEYKISLKKLLCAHTRHKARAREGKENSTALKFTTPGGKVPAEKLRLLNPNEIKATQRSHRSYFGVRAGERERERRTKSGFIMKTRDAIRTNLSRFSDRSHA
jgi:hypothetical protein